MGAARRICCFGGRLHFVTKKQKERKRARIERSKQTAREIYDEQGQDPVVALRRSIRVPKKRPSGGGMMSDSGSDSD